MGIIGKVLAKFNRAYVKQIPLANGWSLYVPTDHYNNVNTYVELSENECLLIYIEYSDGEEATSTTIKIFNGQVSVDDIAEAFDELQIDFEEKSLTLLE